VFPPTDGDDEEPFFVLPWFWLPADTVAERVKKDSVPYDVWEKEGLFIITEGNVVDYAAVEAKIEEIGTRFNIREIAYDRWQAAQMSQNLERMGYLAVPFGQGFAAMSAPTKELMRLSLSGKIAHGGNPVLRWMADNIHVRRDAAGNIKVDKSEESEKVDGIVALIMALDRAIRCGNAVPVESVYNSRGLIFI